MGPQGGLDFVGLQRGVDDASEHGEEGGCGDSCGDGENCGYLIRKFINCWTSGKIDSE
jgi:hypothetical protein